MRDETRSIGVDCANRKTGRFRLHLAAFILLAAMAGRARATESIKLMTFNLRYASAADGSNGWHRADQSPFRRTVALETIARHAPDLIGFQEGEGGQMDELAAGLGSAFRVQYRHPSGGGGNETAGFAYRTNVLELVDSGYFSLGPKPGDGYWENPPGAPFDPWEYFPENRYAFPRLAAWGAFRWRATGQEFLFYTTHFDVYNATHSGTSQVKSAALIVKDAAARSHRMPGPRLAIVLGDFNGSQNDGAWKVFTGSLAHEGTAGDYTDSWQQVHGSWTGSGTFHGFSGGTQSADNRIDWILHRGGFTATQAAIAADYATSTNLTTGQTHKLYASDHYPVVATLRFPPPNLLIAHPAGDATAVPNATQDVELSGSAPGIAGTIWWSNALSGAAGSIPHANPWSIGGVPLRAGTNVIHVEGIVPGPAEETTAQDWAANYAGWSSGDNRGDGFGAWTFHHAQGSGVAGVFIGDPAAAGVGGLGPTAFGFYAHPPGSGANAEVRRAFARALNRGHVFRIDLGLNWDSDSEGSSRGFSLMAGETELVNVNMRNTAAIAINGQPLFANYGTQAMAMRFEYVASGKVRAWGTGRDGTETFDRILDVPAGVPTGFKLYYNAASVPGSPDQDKRQMYFDNLSITARSGATTAQASVAIVREADGGQDTNGDGVPDAWYVQYGLNPSDAGAGNQMAPNGYRYGDCYRMQLDPGDLGTTPFRMVVGQDGSLSFIAPTGRRYAVQYKDDMIQPTWTFLREQGTGGSIDDPAGAERRIYRAQFMGME